MGITAQKVQIPKYPSIVFRATKDFDFHIQIGRLAGEVIYLKVDRVELIELYLVLGRQEIGVAIYGQASRITAKSLWLRRPFLSGPGAHHIEIGARSRRCIQPQAILR